MYGSSPLRSTLNTGYITGLDMCKVCTEAVHSAALWTCVQVQKNVIIPTPPHPTPPHPIPCDVCAGDSGWKKWCKIVPVCTCDSSLCARVTPWPFATCKKLKVSQRCPNFEIIIFCWGKASYLDRSTLDPRITRSSFSKPRKSMSSQCQQWFGAEDFRSLPSLWVLVDPFFWGLDVLVEFGRWF